MGRISTDHFKTQNFIESCPRAAAAWHVIQEVRIRESPICRAAWMRTGSSTNQVVLPSQFTNLSTKSIFSTSYITMYFVTGKRSNRVPGSICRLLCRLVDPVLSKRESNIINFEGKISLFAHDTRTGLHDGSPGISTQRFVFVVRNIFQSTFRNRRHYLYCGVTRFKCRSTGQGEFHFNLHRHRKNRLAGLSGSPKGSMLLGSTKAES